MINTHWSLKSSSLSLVGWDMLIRGIRLDEWEELYDRFTLYRHGDDDDDDNLMDVTRECLFGKCKYHTHSGDRVGW